MDDDMLLLSRPSDRRLLDDNNIYPGPPGVEGNDFEIDLKKRWQPDVKGAVEVLKEPPPPKVESRPRSKSRDRRSPSKSCSRSRSPSRSRSRSRGRRGRSHSRNRSPDDRRGGRKHFRSSGGYDRSFKSKRVHSPIRNRGRDRGRDRSRSRSRGNSRDRYRSNYENRRNNRRISRSRSPRREWSPHSKKKSSPPLPQAPPPPAMSSQPAYVPVQQQQQQQQQPPQQTMYADTGYNNYQANVQQYQQQQQQQQTINNPYGYGDYAIQSSTNQYTPGYPAPVIQPITTGDDFTHRSWAVPPPQLLQQVPPIAQSVPPPAVQPIGFEEDKMKRDAAVVQEMQNQRATLCKQRDDYRRRASTLKRELKTLKEQRVDMIPSTGAPPSPTSKSFIKENDRLQTQIQNKLNTIDNIMEMLSGIIGKDGSPTPPPPPQIGETKVQSPQSHNSSPERLKNSLIESLVRKRGGDIHGNIKVPDSFESDAKKSNFIHYDPEMHWCKLCNVFPKTAKDYLNHLHSVDHQTLYKTVETPWHDNLVNDDMPVYANAPSKRTPIRGLQFFVPSTGWYCKLCAYWMGDLHCASLHLKSKTHTETYNRFAEQNLHFEVDWMAERQKSYDQSREPLVAPPPPSLTGTTISVSSIETKGSTSAANSTGGVKVSQIFESIPLQLQLMNASSVISTKAQLNQESNHAEKEETKKSKKKKKKGHDDKKDKKRRKKSKRRRRSSTSSDTSSTESEDTDSAKNTVTSDDGMQLDSSTSIRAAMRTLLKTTQAKEEALQLEQQKKKLETESAIGKWTLVRHGRNASNAMVSEQMYEPIVPPPPPISGDSKKKDEPLLSQWVTPEPIISESEKKLLEELKGKLKKNPSAAEKDKRVSEKDRSQKITRDKGREVRDRSKDREQDRSKDRERDRSKDREQDRSKDREQDRSKDREQDRSKDRERDRSKDRERDRRGDGGGSSGRRRNSRGRRTRSKSRSPAHRHGGGMAGGSNSSNSNANRRRRSRSRSRSRSWSRGRPRVIEKAVVKYLPEFRPRIDQHPKLKTKEERNKSPTTQARKAAAIASAAAAAATVSSKKLPFIGRMPVFKKHPLSDCDKKYNEDQLQTVDEPEVAPQPPIAVYEAEDDLMPDPEQLMAIMSAPPPPPSLPMPLAEVPEKEDVLPPGIDAAEADQVPKPISDAPRPRKGPLPKDFQDALAIIFPGERRPDGSDPATVDQSVPPLPPPPPPPPPELDGATSMEPVAAGTGIVLDQTMILSDEMSQHNIDIYAYSNAFAGMYDPNGQMMKIPEIVPPPSSLAMTDGGLIPDVGNEENGTDDDLNAMNYESKSMDSIARNEELDDLAMLGIDASDLAAQCI